MNTTSVVGVWSQQLTENLTVIVDTNRNQIIKRKNGRSKIFKFPSEPTLGMIDCMIKTIRISEDIKDEFNEVVEKYCKERGIEGKAKKLLLNRTGEA